MGQVSDFIQKVKGEIDYKEGDRKKVKYSKYDREFWDAPFVSWCAKESNISTSIIPSESKTSKFEENLKSLGGKIVKSPEIGDLYFYTNYISKYVERRVAVVCSVDPVGRRLTLIQGDVNGVVAKIDIVDYTVMDDEQFFIRPNYIITDSTQTNNQVMTFTPLTPEDVRLIDNWLPDPRKNPSYYESHPGHLFFIKKPYGGFSPSSSGSGIQPSANCVPYAWGRAMWAWSEMIEKSGYMHNQQMMARYNHGQPFESGYDYLQKVYNIEQLEYSNAEDMIEKSQYMGTQKNDDGYNYKTLRYEIPYQVSSSLHHGFQADGLHDIGMDIYAKGMQYLGTENGDPQGMAKYRNPQCVPMKGALLIYATGTLWGISHGYHAGSGSYERYGHVMFVEDFTDTENVKVFESGIGPHNSPFDGRQLPHAWNLSVYSGGYADNGHQDRIHRYRNEYDYVLGYIYPPEECGTLSYGRYKLKSTYGHLGFQQIKNRLWVI